ncbi:MAG TPA: hypothetical protein VMS86_13195, partial [Thermoanaerobaculia bacterium]|nr:hypothetical protein [Thermoanaerobaculia bacterium]
MSLMRAALLLSTVFAVVGATGCRSRTEEPAAAPPGEPAAQVPDASAAAPVVEVTVEDFAFVAPPEVRSGWNTFRMTNTGEQPHFLLLWRLPEGVTFEDYAETLSRPFQEAYDPYFRGEV